ncbi:ABC transporter permease [Desulfosporosinus metallidurans]|uniref:Ribose ABC transport system, permease protein RbsC n=1 Tax=Desulfosporosinus metallidurans TaxID=1888891 RepID=A0A1Q8QV16_9FIRM|nr:ABC transporter permease [Desulfosporosinus metallidurans]OLN31193.1 Ribose ABC transport system, permease protein RbsC [Desulfosporosinus metallidurans]
MKEMGKQLFWLQLLRTYGTVVAAVFIMIGFSVLSPASFATWDNAINISRQISFLVIIALGATLVMAIGEFDLSVGAMASFGGVVAAKLVVQGLPFWAAFLIPLGIAFGIGFINGWIVTQFRVLSFITSMAMGTILGGFTFWLTGGTTIFENIPESFRYLGQSELLGIPILSLLMVLLTIIFWFIMAHTALGRRLYALGGNEAASRIAGINVSANKNLAFALCATLAALAGILMASRLGSAHPTGGNGLFLPAYAAAFLGMTTFKEGVPNIWGTFVGAAIIGILANGLTILEVPTFMQDVITGVIVISAVILQKLGRK